MEGQCMSGNESNCEIFIVLCRVTQISRTWFYILVGVFFFFFAISLSGWSYHSRFSLSPDTFILSCSLV